jgi:NAD(P)H-hydrate repair Nnr-like enzyme with NAD(P)H-hydrate dehydratase domain
MSAITEVFHQLHHPGQLSHKGQNGKVLIIGGSDLFHAASQWSFQVAARLVDMVFYSSVAENNELMRDAKMYGHDGVIVPRAELPNYAEEATAILIGPGMRRDTGRPWGQANYVGLQLDQLRPEDWENDTAAVTAALLQAFPDKPWVIDAGALQVVDPAWLPQQAILTPHWQELERLLSKLPDLAADELTQLHQAMTTVEHQLVQADNRPAQLHELSEYPNLMPYQPLLQRYSQQLHDAVLLIKGPLDLVGQHNTWYVIDGGNAAMTKGGTGDVLAGLVAGLAATSDPLLSAVAASFLNKQAGYELWQRQGSMFSSTDLANQLPLVWQQY